MKHFGWISYVSDPSYLKEPAPRMVVVEIMTITLAIELQVMG